MTDVSCESRIRPTYLRLKLKFCPQFKQNIKTAAQIGCINSAAKNINHLAIIWLSTLKVYFKFFFLDKNMMPAMLVFMLHVRHAKYMRKFATNFKNYCIWLFSIISCNNAGKKLLLITHTVKNTEHRENVEPLIFESICTNYFHYITCFIMWAFQPLTHTDTQTQQRIMCIVCKRSAHIFLPQKICFAFSAAKVPN